MLRHYGYTARPDGVIGESAWVVSAYINKKAQLRKYPMVLAPPELYAQNALASSVPTNSISNTDENVKFSLKDQLKKQKI